MPNCVVAAEAILWPKFSFFLFFRFLLGFCDSSAGIITATVAPYEAVNRRRSVFLMLIKYHGSMFLYN